MADVSHNSIKFTAYEKYCNKCYYEEVPQGWGPCNDCLQESAQEGTEKPLYFKEKESDN